MDRTSADGFVLNGSGKRIRIGENAVTGTQGTETDPNYDNDAQEELIGGFLEYVGLAPTAGAVRQLQQALFRLFGGNITTISSSQALTPDNSGLVLVNASAGNLALTMPPVASANGAITRFLFLRTDTTSNTVTISTAAGETIAPGALGSLSLVNGQTFELTGNGSTVAGNKFWRLAVSARTTQAPFYEAFQSGSIAIANNTLYTVASLTITFPAFSATGAFRVAGRMQATGLTSGAGLNNFTSRVSDGTNVLFGAPWLQLSEGSGDTWGVADSFESNATYAPGSTVTFAMETGTAAGATTFTLAGCSFGFFVREA
jgi:hypothetical protein